MSKLSYTPVSEEIWRRAERDQLLREKIRLHRNKTVRPRRDLPPTTLYKSVEGAWKRALGFFHPLKLKGGA